MVANIVKVSRKKKGHKRHLHQLGGAKQQSVETFNEKINKLKMELITNINSANESTPIYFFDILLLIKILIYEYKNLINNEYLNLIKYNNELFKILLYICKSNVDDLDKINNYSKEGNPIQICINILNTLEYIKINNTRNIKLYTIGYTYTSITDNIFNIFKDLCKHFIKLNTTNNNLKLKKKIYSYLLFFYDISDLDTNFNTNFNTNTNNLYNNPINLYYFKASRYIIQIIQKIELDNSLDDADICFRGEKDIELDNLLIELHYEVVDTQSEISHIFKNLIYYSNVEETSQINKTYMTICKQINENNKVNKIDLALNNAKYNICKTIIKKTQIGDEIHINSNKYNEKFKCIVNELDKLPNKPFKNSIVFNFLYLCDPFGDGNDVSDIKSMLVYLMSLDMIHNIINELYGEFINSKNEYILINFFNDTSKCELDLNPKNYKEIKKTLIKYGVLKSDTDIKKEAASKKKNQQSENKKDKIQPKKALKETKKTQKKTGRCMLPFCSKGSNTISIASANNSLSKEPLWSDKLTFLSLDDIKKIINQQPNQA